MNPAARTLVPPQGAAFPFNTVDTYAMPEDPTSRVEMTVSAMCALTHHAAAVGPEVAKLAARITGGAKLGQLWHILKNGQHHVEDPAGTELLRHPEQSAARLNAGQLFDGDCDDVALLAAAVLIRLGGYVVAFRVVARAGNEWEHVYVVARQLRGSENYFPIDPQETDQVFDERDHERARDFVVWRASR